MGLKIHDSIKEVFRKAIKTSYLSTTYRASLKKENEQRQILKVKQLRKKELSVEDLIGGIQKGDKIALARAITLIESSNPEHFQKADLIIGKCIGNTTKSIRVGITGVPGVGKSTFIEALGTYLTQKGKKVAVLAVDPSSSLSKGSILGDKTRMETLAKDPNAFIRPSPSNQSLGGVAQKTREAMILCEAAGYDIILVETVGVGQSETAVHSMVDFFLLLKLAGAGDELQGIKRGIMEMADAIVINKANGNNLERVKLAEAEFRRALHLYPPKPSGWTPKVTRCSALHNSGIDNVWEIIEDFVALTTEKKTFKENRIQQNKNWFLQSVEEQLKQHFYQNKKVKHELDRLMKAIQENKISPFAAAQKLLDTKGLQLD